MIIKKAADACMANNGAGATEELSLKKEML